eukprot:jgi/Galph1/5454/GphlegSOOS_G4066.1
MQLRIGLPDGSVSSIQVETEATIDELKEQIMQEKKLDPKTKRVRLIHAGKLMSEGSSKLEDCKLEDGSYIHCVISDIVNAQSGHTTTSGEREERLHTRIPAVDSNSAYRGLDRLREAGFSEVEIASLRRQFLRAQGYNPDNLQEGVDLRDLEERWLTEAAANEVTVGDLENGVLNDESFFGDNEGSIHDFVFGMVVGFLLGIIVLVFLLDRGIPRKRKLGILAGVVANLLFGVLRSTWLMTHDEGPAPALPGE